MRRLVDAIIQEWLCRHEWEFWYKEHVKGRFAGNYTVYHFACRKCGKRKRIKTW